MKVTIYNTITAVLGILCMVGYILTAGMDAELGVLALIWVATAVISIVETMLIVSVDQAIQNEKERQLAASIRAKYKK